MKIYELRFTVRHGEYCFNKMNIFEAKDMKDATLLAHKWCCDFYGKGEQEEDNLYIFQTGCIALKIDSVMEIVDKEAWKEFQYEDSFIRDI